ncbi:MAG: radical SAM protein [Ruminococcaceae bacterium]|nr:radical SAM protein [Oscillospiraceae bacterium]
MARICPVFIPHEGCPHDCVFCNQRRIAAPVSPEPAEIRERVCAAIRAGLCDEVAFYGGSFTAIPAARQEAFLSAVSDLPVSIRLSTRPDAVDGPVIQRLLRHGVKTVELGAQSMDDEILRRAARGHTAADVRWATGLLQQAGFSVILQVMVGLPGDRDTWRDTAEAAAALHPDGVRIYPVVVIRDTALYDLWQAGRYAPLSVSEGADAAADMLEVFLREKIPVIRIGLNPTEELSGGSAVAGAYHPALGEMARSRVLLRRVLKELAGADLSGRCLTIFVPRGRTSQAVGVGQENRKRLMAMGARRVRVIEEESLTGDAVRTLLE